MISVLASLGIWEYINANGGLDTDIADLKLSTGQRQLINIARAFLHHKENKTMIALMDEVTTALDEATAKRVMEAIEDAFDDCTVIMVEHRESALSHMDFSLELSAGSTISVVDRTSSHTRTLVKLHKRMLREQEMQEQRFKGAVIETVDQAPSKTRSILKGKLPYYTDPARLTFNPEAFGRLCIFTGSSLITRNSNSIQQRRRIAREDALLSQPAVVLIPASPTPSERDLAI